MQTSNGWLLKLVIVVFYVRSLLHFVVGGCVDILELQKLLRNLAHSSSFW
jgi:hypothetical protein